MFKMELVLLLSGVVFAVHAAAAPEFDDSKDKFKMDPIKPFKDDSSFKSFDDSFKEPSAKDVANMEPKDGSHFKGSYKSTESSEEIVDGKVVKHNKSGRDVENKDGKVTDKKTGN